MIKIYHIPRTRSLRIVWLMEELGEPYEIERLGFPVPESFLEVNPLGAIPTIEDIDGGETIRLFESLAILQYITGRRLVAGDAKAASLTVGPKPDPAAYAEHLQFLHFGESDLATPLGVIFRTQVFTGEQTNASIGDQLSQLRKRFAFLDAHLSDGREWVTGETFTIADISIGYAFVLLGYTNVDCELPEHALAYRDRLLARPAYLRAAAV